MGSWQGQLIERLAAAVGPDGSWGYSPGGPGSAEATALAAMALAAHDEHSLPVARGCAWLASIQGEDGGVPLTASMPGPCWPTSLALWAWVRVGRTSVAIGTGGQAGGGTPVGHGVLVGRAVSWLLETRGVPIAPDRRLFGHDTTLQGWPWVRDTHSWVEPTGHAVIALTAAGHGSHARVREGTRLLRDRALPEGGWNYGNTRVLDHVLRPFPAPTGVALLALSGGPRDERIDAAIAYLSTALEDVRSPFSLGWGLMGLSAWGAKPASCDVWMSESAVRSMRRVPNLMYDAVLLLAGAEDGGTLNVAGATYEGK